MPNSLIKPIASALQSRRAECYTMTQGDGSQLHQRAPLDSEERYSYRRHHDCVSSFAHNHHRRQRNMTWNRSRRLFWQLAVAFSMIAMAAGHMHTVSAPVNLDFEEEFFYAVESSDQSFDYSSHLEKDRSLQFNNGQPQTIPTPFSFPPIPPIIIQFGKPSRTGKYFFPQNVHQ
jgi:hypothetical protein